MRKATLLAFFVAALLALAPDTLQPRTFAAPPSPTAAVPKAIRSPFFAELKPDGMPPRLASAPDSSAQRLVPMAGYDVFTKIAFQSYRNDNWEIYIAKGDGSAQTRLTANLNIADTYPRLNRGCTRLAFSSKRTGNYDIFTMNPDGSQVQQVTTHALDDVAPAWSPDGSRIAFQSYRDGQSEIYVMNADGTGQARLTANDIYDGQPNWSPDGSRIAFTSYRNQQYRIWAMNADGTNPVQLSGQAYSEFPVWSPDGTQLAYDADADGNGFQEIWLVNADGSNQRVVLAAGEANTDLMPRSWSPTGNKMAYTRLNLLYYQGSWYWTAGNAEIWTVGYPYTATRLPGSGRDWHPDWQTCDIAPPISRVDPLPPESPASFQATLTGSDVGQAGIWYFYVESSLNDGPWTFLIDPGWFDPGTPYRSVHGRAGEKLSFRVRARDNSGNEEPVHQTPDTWTRIESYPPVVTLDPLPFYTQNSPITVRWKGTDPGGSGISGYTVEYKDATGAGEWAPWLDGVGNTSADFGGAPGHRYCFRLRAQDGAGNVSGWTAREQVQCSTIFTWYITASVRSNRGGVVSGATLATEPPTIDLAVTDAGGWTKAHLAPPGPSVTYALSKEGYGLLPGTILTSTTNVDVLAVLPPPDSVVADPGFESGGLAAGPWTLVGAGGAEVTAAARHTGAYGLEVGWVGPALTRTEFITDVAGELGPPRMAIGADGTVHVVWRHGISLWYSRRDSDGEWSAVEKVGNQDVTFPELDAALDLSGTLHVVWDNSMQIMHAQRPATGAWTASEIIGQFGYMGAKPFILTGPGNTLHVYWDDYDGFANVYYLRYATRGEGGSWIASVLAGPQAGYSEPDMAVGGDGTVHAVWAGNGVGSGHVTYARRPAGGAWSAAESASGDYDAVRRPEVVLGGDGAVHVAYYVIGQQQFYVRRAPAGGWSAPAGFLNQLSPGTQTLFAADALGRLHRFWNDGYGVSHSMRSASGAWSPLDIVCGNYSCRMDADGQGVVMGANGLAYVVVKTGTEANGAITYFQGPMNGVWSAARPVASDAPWGHSPVMALDGQGLAHVVWASAGGATSTQSVAHASLSTGDEPATYGAALPVTVPVPMSAPTLSFVYRRGEASRMPTVPFVVSVDTGITRTNLLSLAATSGRWAQGWADMAPWTGQSITVSLTLTRAGGEAPGTVQFDEVSVGSAFAGMWLGADGGEGLPGEPLTLGVRYGNRSGIPATGVRVTATLPLALDFPAASPGPVAGTGIMVWDLGDLTAGSQGTLAITGTVPATVQALSTYYFTVSATTAGGELDLEDNQATGRIFTGHRRFLPLVARLMF